MGHGGFIKLYRDFLEWEWYRDGPTKELYLHLLLCAAYHTQEIRGVELHRGQYLTSYTALAAETGLTMRQVRTAIDHLREGGEVLCESSARYTILTVMDFDRHPPAAAKRHAERHENDTIATKLPIIKEGKNAKKGEKKEKCLSREELETLFGTEKVRLYLKKAAARGYEDEQALRKAEIWLLEDEQRAQKPRPPRQPGECFPSSIDPQAWESWMWKRVESDVRAMREKEENGSATEKRKGEARDA